MDNNSSDIVARILRSYDLLQEALVLLEKSGQDDICAALYLPLGLLEERFELASPSEVEEETLRKNSSISRI